MKKYNKFETVYNYSRQYALGKLAGCHLLSQIEYDKNNIKFKSLVYQTFKQEVQMMFGFDIDRNTWVFDQNELKTNSTGKETLKGLCRTVYFNNEALYLADGK